MRAAAAKGLVQLRLLSFSAELGGILHFFGHRRRGVGLDVPVDLTMLFGILFDLVLIE
jgi:hypothetical protein